MGKKLLLALMALVMTVGAFAYEQDQYVFTPTQRLKLTSAPLSIASTSGTSGWTMTEESQKSVSDVITAQDGKLVFKSTTAADAMYTSCEISEAGTYIAVFKISNPAEAFTSVAGTAAALKRIVLAANAEGDDNLATIDGATAPVVSGTTFAVSAEEQECAIAINVTSMDNKNIVFIVDGLPEGTILSDLQVFKATEVYDVRKFKEVADYASLLLSIPDFCVDAEETANFQGMTEALLEMYQSAIDGSDEYDTEAAAASVLGDINTEDTYMYMMEQWLKTSSANMQKYIQGIDGEFLKTRAHFNRGWGGDSNLQLTGGNWQTSDYSDVIFTQIQGSFTNENQCYTAYNTNLPKGKYFIYMEVRNAYCDGKYNLTWNLETTPSLFIGKDTTAVETPIVGDKFQAFYKIGEVEEDGAFRAGVFWPGYAGGARFEVKNVKIRAFGDVDTYVARKTAVDAFLGQWNALVSAKKNLEAEIATPTADYVWGRDSLTNAMSDDITKAWYDATIGEEKVAVNAISTYKKVLADGWVSSEKTETYVLDDVADASVVSNDDLADWAASNKVGMSAVRQLQGALNYLKNYNKVFTDLDAAIAEANGILEDPMNADGDKATFQTAINAASTTLSSVLASTSDATRVTAVDPETGAPTAGDSVVVAKATADLATAVEAFKKSAELKPIVDIDFSKGATLVETGSEEEGNYSSYYAAKSADGNSEMVIKSYEPDNNVGGTAFMLGCKGENEEILRVGNGLSYVDLTKFNITENDVVRVSFDLYWCSLIDCVLYTGLSNLIADDEAANAKNSVLAGFAVRKYPSKKAAVVYNSWASSTNPTWYNCADTKKNENNVLVDGTKGPRLKAEMEIIADLKAHKIKASNKNQTNSIDNSPAAITKHETDEVFMNEAIVDIVPKEFYLGSDYSNENRRCWFDNLKIYVYPSTSEPYTGVTEAPTAAAKVAKAIKLIENGKFVIKSAKGTFNAVGAKIAD